MMSFLVLSMGCGGPGARTVPCSNGSMAHLDAPIAPPITVRAAAGLLLSPNDFCVPSLNVATHLPITDSELVLQDRVAEWSSRGRLQPTIWSSTPAPTLHRSIGPSVLRFCGPAILDHLITAITGFVMRCPFGVRSFMAPGSALLLQNVTEYAVGTALAAFPLFLSQHVVAGRVNSIRYNTMMLGALVMLTPVDAAPCRYCKDTIPGCGKDNDCPLVKTSASNAQIFKDNVMTKTPNLVNLVTSELSAHVGRQVCDAIVGLYNAPAVGTEIDFERGVYATSQQAVVKAALYGHCSVCEAADVLGSRLEAATEANEMTKIKGAIEALKLVEDGAGKGSQGVCQFVWAKLSQVIAKRSSGTHSLRIDSGKEKASSLSATLARPETESAFYELMHMWLMVIVGLGLALFPVAARFLDDVAYGTIRMREGWQVAHELLMIYFKEIDMDMTRSLSMANVFRRGGQDTFLAEARRNTEMFFRTRVGAAREGSPSKSANGKFNDKSDRACKDYNAGRPCTRLDANGACIFNHKCNQFVTDKGKNGVCFGAHPRCEGCSYAADKKCAKPATA